jgi:hypothetical protein
MKVPGLDRLGMTGVIGIGCLLFSPAFYFGKVAPAEEQLVSLNAERRQLEAAAGPVRSIIPAIAEAPEVLKRLAALFEKDRLVVENMSYAMRDDAGERRLEISFPLKVSYPLLRTYLRDALALTPTASLDELILQRSRADEANVDAQVRLSFRFSAAS